MPRSTAWKATESDRFWSKVDKSGDCWMWMSSRSPQGYGTFRFEGKTKSAHRLVYQQEVRELRPDEHLDHLCRNRGCVRIAHLEVVSNSENTRRGYASRGHCRNGHPKEGNEVCRECQREQRSRYHERRMEYQRRYRAANPGKHAAYERKYREQRGAS